MDSAIKNGDFEKVIQLSKDYRNFEVQKKAKDNIDVSINNAIDHAYNRAIKNKYEVDKSLTILIKIASDNNLKNLHKTGQIKSAGLKVRLTAKGLSNPEIGARLFIGRATVKTHLTHIFTKLGVTSRAELAAEATRRGL